MEGEDEMIKALFATLYSEAIQKSVQSIRTPVLSFDIILLSRRALHKKKKKCDFYSIECN